MKKYGVVLASVLFVGLLTGCGDNTTEVAENTEITVDAITEEITTEEQTTTEESGSDVASEEVTTEEVTTELTTEYDETQTTEQITTEQKTTEKKTTEQKTTEKKTTEQKTTEKKTTEKNKKTTEKKEEKKTTEVATEAAKSNKDIAKGYIGSPLSSLVAAIGSYSSLVQDEGCIEGFDAIAYYDGFSVMCHSEDQVNWIIVDVY